MSRKLLLDLDQLNGPRPSIIQQFQPPQSFRQIVKSSPHKPQVPMETIFNRVPDIIHAPFQNDEVIRQPTCSQYLIGALIIAVSVALITLALPAYMIPEGDTVQVAMQMSLIFCVANLLHFLKQLVSRESWAEEQNRGLVKIIAQGVLLKLCRILLTTYLLQRFNISYVSLTMGYSSHVKLILLIFKNNQSHHKALLGIALATVIPITLTQYFTTTLLGMVLMLCSLRLELLKEKPITHSITWGLSFLFLLFINKSYPSQYDITNYTLILVSFCMVLLSSKLGKQFLLPMTQRYFISEQVTLSCVKLTPLVIAIVYEYSMDSPSYGVSLLIGIAGTMISEYKSKVDDDSDWIVFN